MSFFHFFTRVPSNLFSSRHSTFDITGTANGHAGVFLMDTQIPIESVDFICDC